MASTNNTETVMAWGDNGLERTPREEVVEIPALPLAPGNKAIPATIRSLMPFGTFKAPRRLVGISRKGLPWPLIKWRDADGRLACCYVRSLGEACDPLFDTLPAHSRRRIAAVAPGTLSHG